MVWNTSYQFYFFFSATVVSVVVSVASVVVAVGLVVDVVEDVEAAVVTEEETVARIFQFHIQYPFL